MPRTLGENAPGQAQMPYTLDYSTTLFLIVILLVAWEHTWHKYDG